MFTFPPTLILRHRKENLKKCSLYGLEVREDLRFFTYPKDLLPDLSSYVLLTLNAPVLSEEDKNKGLFLIDGTWRYAEIMRRQLPQPHRFEVRSLPPLYITAYPRRQDVERGLASVEALYAAYCITQKNPLGLLDHYHWKKEFLNTNAHLDLLRKVE
jgi:pre-rRNA-processing protein TSR3